MQELEKLRKTALSAEQMQEELKRKVQENELLIKEVFSVKIYKACYSF